MKKVPEIRIPNDLVSNKRFLDFVRSEEYGLFLYLQAHIVRGRQKNKFTKVYDNYYKEGFLATQWNQKALSKKFNVSERTIRRWIKNIVDRETGGSTKVEGRKVYTKWDIYTLDEVGFKKDETVEQLYYIKKLTKKPVKKEAKKNLLKFELNDESFKILDAQREIYRGDTDVPFILVLRMHIA